MLHLLQLISGEVVSSTPLNKARVDLGRETNNDIVLNSPEISRHHARLMVSEALMSGDAEGTANLLDLGSAYGVWVEGQQVSYHELRVGEAFQVSSTLSLALSFDASEVLTVAPVVTLAEPDEPVFALPQPLEPMYETAEYSTAAAPEHFEPASEPSAEVSETFEAPAEEPVAEAAPEVSETFEAPAEEPSPEVSETFEEPAEEPSPEVSETFEAPAVEPSPEVSETFEAPAEEPSPEVSETFEAPAEEPSPEVSETFEAPAEEPSPEVSETFEAPAEEPAVEASPEVSETFEAPAEEPPEVSETFEAPAEEPAAYTCSTISLDALNKLQAQLKEQLVALEGSLPAGSQASRALSAAQHTLSGLERLTAPQGEAPLGEALTAWRARVAPLCPAEFSLHIDPPEALASLSLDLRVIEALHLATVALLEADEVEWLSISCSLEEGQLRLHSDPPLKRYLNPREPLQSVALSLLP